MTDCSDGESSIITEDSFSDLSDRFDTDSDTEQTEEEEEYDISLRCERCNTLIETFYYDLEPEAYSRIIQVITNEWIDMTFNRGILEPGYHMCLRCS